MTEVGRRLMLGLLVGPGGIIWKTKKGKFSDFYNSIRKHNIKSSKRNKV